MLVSSAYEWPISPWFCTIFRTSAVYSKNSSGPSTLPCGTPQITAEIVDRSLPTWTAWVLPVTKDSIQDKTEPVMPNYVCKQSSRMVWSTVSVLGPILFVLYTAMCVLLRTAVYMAPRCHTLLRRSDWLPTCQYVVIFGLLLSRYTYSGHPVDPPNNTWQSSVSCGCCSRLECFSPFVKGRSITDIVQAPS